MFLTMPEHLRLQSPGENGDAIQGRIRLRMGTVDRSRRAGIAAVEAQYARQLGG